MKKALVASVSALLLSSAFVGLANSVPTSSVTAADAPTVSQSSDKRDLGWG